MRPPTQDIPTNQSPIKAIRVNQQICLRSSRWATAHLSREMKVLLLALSPMLYAACSRQVASPPLSGVVRSASSQQPIAGATVAAYRHGYASVARTDATGRFSLAPIRVPAHSRFYERQWPPLFVTAWAPLYFPDETWTMPGYIPTEDPLTDGRPAQPINFKLKPIQTGL